MASNHCMQFSLSFQLIQGTTYYSLPSNYDTIMRVTIGQKYIPQQSVASLDGKSRGWEAASGYPSYYFINFSSRTMIGFAPWPQQPSDIDTIKIEYDIQPNNMVLTTDLPFNGISELSQYDHMLAYYAAAQMASVNSDMDHYKAYMDYYNAFMKVMEDHCTEVPAYLPSAAGSP